MAGYFNFLAIFILSGIFMKKCVFMDKDKSFKPTKEWMAAKYDEMNKWLFDGSLGECYFDIFTTGKGSQGRTLGWFKMTGNGIYTSWYDCRLYKENYYSLTGDTSINHSNFFELCRPMISLNGNYTGTEKGFTATLVHEMCHYYTYMDGRAPKQGHGREFKRIGSIVSSRSNGMFTIQRIASAEDMSEFELSDEMKAKNEKRANRKKSIVTAIIVTTKEGKIMLTITSNKNLLERIVTVYKRRGENVITTNDYSIIDYLFKKGCNKNMRTWRYWSLEAKPWINEFKSMLKDKGIESVDTEEPQQETKPQEKTPRRIFSIKTSSGKFECDGTALFSLRKALKERFPKMSDEAIDKIIQNPNNYRMEENKISVKKIVESVINEYINNDSKGRKNIIKITPDMNLGQYSPLEIE